MGKIVTPHIYGKVVNGSLVNRIPNSLGERGS